MIAIRLLFISSVLTGVLGDVATIDAGGNLDAVVRADESSLEDLVVDEGKAGAMYNASQIVVTDATAELEDEEEYEEEEEEEGDYDEEEGEEDALDKEDVGPGSDFGDVQIFEIEEQKIYLAANFVEMEPLDPEVILKHVEETEMYLKEIVDKDEKYSEVRDMCQNYDPMCTVWALSGDCEVAEEQPYMVQYCGPACKMCDKINPAEHFSNFEDENDNEDKDDEELVKDAQELSGEDATVLPMVEA